MEDFPESKEPLSVDDALSKIQLRVAQRADEIARGRASRSTLNLDCWLLAEAEFFREALILKSAVTRTDWRATAAPRQLDEQGVYAGAVELK